MPMPWLPARQLFPGILFNPLILHCILWCWSGPAAGQNLPVFAMTMGCGRHILPIRQILPEKIAGSLRGKGRVTSW